MKKNEMTSERRILTILTASALSCVVISIASGLFAALYYIPQIARYLLMADISLQQLRPLHTTYASAWIFLGGITCIWKYLFESFGEPTKNDLKHWRFQIYCWLLAGLGILVTLPLGITSGREYLGFHPIFSLLILFGWLSFAFIFFKKVSKGFWSQPIYIYFWATGILYFIYTFIEGHAWLLPEVINYPIVDIQIQWKSCGTLVASFNQIVYGCLFYVSEKVSGETKISRSHKTFLFFCIGLLNSFTNYPHHTYHLPQDHLIKWIAFIVSMLEIVFLFSILSDIVSILHQRSQGHGPKSIVYRFFELSKCWSFFLLFLALLISIPPLNSMIHGTHVVMAHAMGSEIAIDSFILFAVIMYLYPSLLVPSDQAKEIMNNPQVPSYVSRLNFSLICLVILLLFHGLNTGLSRLSGQVISPWEKFPYLLAFFGFFLAYYLIRLMKIWLPALFSSLQRSSRNNT